MDTFSPWCCTSQMLISSLHGDVPSASSPVIGFTLCSCSLCCLRHEGQREGGLVLDFTDLLPELPSLVLVLRPATRLRLQLGQLVFVRAHDEPMKLRFTLEHHLVERRPTFNRSEVHEVPMRVPEKPFPTGQRKDLRTASLVDLWHRVERLDWYATETPSLEACLIEGVVLRRPRRQHVPPPAQELRDERLLRVAIARRLRQRHLRLLRHSLPLPPPLDRQQPISRDGFTLLLGEEALGLQLFCSRLPLLLPLQRQHSISRDAFPLLLGEEALSLRVFLRLLRQLCARSIRRRRACR
mmetsp:Transcript_19804/g.54612  ORF Transcript_19804/g.54612 Transcript_19804/m.54612 type:complete len:297 (+) Transcript_19804:96-986(+)